jgi:Family of unknown function (DUF6118)
MTDLDIAPEDAASGDPAQAFDALRAANTAGFQAVAEQLKVLAAGQAALAKAPALQQTPKQIADEQAKQRAEMLDLVREEWREPTRHANSEWKALVKLTTGIRARADQNLWLVAAAVAGFAAYPLLAMTTPYSGRLAAWTMGHKSLWVAGNKLMQEGNPEQSNVMVAAWNLWDANLDAIKACKAIPVPPGRKPICQLVLPD